MQQEVEIVADTVKNQRGRDQKSPHLGEELLATEKGRVTFLQECELNKRKKHELSSGEELSNGRGIDVGQNALYVCMKISISKKNPKIYLLFLSMFMHTCSKCLQRLEMGVRIPAAEVKVMNCAMCVL